MKYEATIHFELKDEKVDLTELITAQKIDIHGVGRAHGRRRSRVGDADDVGWRRGLERRQEGKMAQATEDVSRRLGVDEETAEQLCEWMSFVYGLMASHGLCAYPGDQPVRVISEALEFMRSRAAAVPEEGE